jgi:hypothetical protein
MRFGQEIQEMLWAQLIFAAVLTGGLRREWNREERKCPLNGERLHAPDRNYAPGRSGEDGK